MGRIAVIKALAFISSIIGRIIALPFALLFHVLKFVGRGLRRLLRFSRDKRNEWHVKRVKGKEKRQQQKIATKSRKEENHKRREQQKLAKRQKKEEELEKRKAAEEKKRLLREEKRANKQLRMREKTAMRAIATAKREKEQRERIEHWEQAWTKRFDKSFLKSNMSFGARILRKLYWAFHWILQKSYWGCRWLFNKAYWGCRWLFNKMYWGCRWLFNKVYWGCRWLFNKMYWGCRWLFNKVYWGCRWLFNKVYWGCRWLFQKGYWIIRTIFEKIYWKIYGVCNRIYWKYYEKSRKWYSKVTKNRYVDVFFIFLRGYLRKSGMKSKCVAISGVSDYVRKNKATSEYHIIEAGIERTVCVPVFFERNEEKLEKYCSPDIYVAKVEHAELIGGSNVIVAKDILLNDSVAYDKEKRIDIRYSAIKKVLDKVAIIEEYNVTDEIERGINLVGAASFNYYHLVVEILSRLTFIDYLERYRKYPILVDEVVLRVPQFKAALECINYYKHPIVVIEKEKQYHVNELIIPSSNVWMPTNLYDRNTIRTEDFLIAESVLRNIRTAVGMWEEHKPWRKIFISRKNTQAVRLSNEMQVRDIFAENGFEIVYTEEMTFRQQVECFGQAKCIIATSGAALTNTIFCQEEAIVGCIIPSEHRFYMYSTIAHLLGLKPIFLDAKITDKTPYAAADTFVLDEGYVRRYVEKINSMM